MFPPVSRSLKSGQILTIAHAAPSDAREIVAYVNQVGGESEYLTFGAGEFDITTEDEEKFIASLEGGKFNFMLQGVVDGHIVSVCTLMRSKRARIQHVGDLGISVARTHWGLGVGRRMCEAMLEHSRRVGVRKVNLKVREDNRNAIRLYESVGFEHEGHATRAYQIAGKFYGDRLMGITLD